MNIGERSAMLRTYCRTLKALLGLDPESKGKHNLLTFGSLYRYIYLFSSSYLQHRHVSHHFSYGTDTTDCDLHDTQKFH